MTGLQKVWLAGVVIIGAVLSNQGWAQDFLRVDSNYSLPAMSDDIYSLNQLPQYEPLNQFLTAYKADALEGIKVYVNSFSGDFTQQIRDTFSKEEFANILSGLPKLIKEKEVYEYFYDGVIRHSPSTDQGKNILFFLSLFKTVPTEITDILAVKLDMAQSEQEREYLLDVLLNQGLSGFGQGIVKKSLQDISSHILSELNREAFHLRTEKLLALDNSQRENLDYGHGEDWWEITKPKEFLDLKIAKDVLANRLGYQLLEFKDIYVPNAWLEYIAAHRLLGYITAAVYTKDIIIPDKDGSLVRATVRQQLAVIKEQMEGNDSPDWGAAWAAGFNAVEEGKSLQATVKSIYVALGFQEKRIYAQSIDTSELTTVEKIDSVINKLVGTSKLKIYYLAAE